MVSEFRFNFLNPWKLTFLVMIDQYFVKGNYGNVGDCPCLTDSVHSDIAMYTSVKAFVNLFVKLCTNNRIRDKLVSDRGYGFNAFNIELKIISGKTTLNSNNSVKNRLIIFDLPMYVSSHALVIRIGRLLCVLDNKDIHITPNTFVYGKTLFVHGSGGMVGAFRTVGSLWSPVLLMTGF